MRYEDGSASYADDQKPFEGVIPNSSALARDRFSRLDARGAVALPERAKCETCGGAAPQTEALAVKIGGLNIARSPSCRSATRCAWFRARSTPSSPKQREIAARILKEINERLGFLDNVG